MMNTPAILRLKQISLASALGLTVPFSAAEEATLLQPVEVVDEAIEDAAFSSSTIDKETIEMNYPATGDTASILSDVPGVHVNQAGGLSGLPSIRGLADDQALAPGQKDAAPGQDPLLGPAKPGRQQDGVQAQGPEPGGQPAQHFVNG